MDSKQNTFSYIFCIYFLVAAGGLSAFAITKIEPGVVITNQSQVSDNNLLDPKLIPAGTELIVLTHPDQNAGGAFKVRDRGTGKEFVINPDQLNLYRDLKESKSTDHCPKPDPQDQAPNPARQPASVAPDPILGALEDSYGIGTQARGQELLSNAEAKLKEISDNAESDQETLNRYYQNASTTELKKRLKTAETTLDQKISELENGTAKLERSEQARLLNTLRNARDKAALGQELLDEQKEDQNADPKSPLAKSDALTQLFGTGPSLSPATSSDALVNRDVMFFGLSNREKAKALKELKLAEKIPVRLPNGSTQYIDFIHNGYILGAVGNSLDCSAFASSALPPDVRKGRFTSMDFRLMWLYRRRGKLPLPPKVEAAHAKLLQIASDAFIPINIYSGDTLLPGDLLVYRLIFDPIGHVFIIKNFDPKTLETEVIEAAQSAGTIRERKFPLTSDPPTTKDRIIRPGLFALRLRPTDNRACTYKNPQRGLSSLPTIPPQGAGL